ncbi:MAG: VOC family protein [Candidatus Dormibacteraeota bacterium]|uniref:VOC family protein n=1 Tax=Candidatus Amunia macphersoniae TaxID=3127014 RepID=A0A934KNH7_9BACT|nr:VOC family protein [Candidatus Dormibacteraeota bacterium]
MADTPTTYPPGTPIWVDLSTSDVDAGRHFYEELFGWTSDEPAPPEYGGYAMFRQGDKLVAGSGPLMEGGHPAWNTYVRSSDAVATAQTVRDAGGEVVVEPMQVMDAGTMAVFKDPTGAYISIWQDGTHKGAELFNEPVSLSWSELGTRDVEAAKRFYDTVFGWTTKGEGYLEWQLDGRSIGGCNDMNAMGMPEQVPPHWLVYFTVNNCDQTADRVKELGGTVNMPARDIPGMGRFTVVADPQGAVFAAFSS